MSIKNRTWEIVEAAKPGDLASKAFDCSILGLIFLNVLAVIAASVASIQKQYGHFLYAFEIISVVVFSFEYILRLWSCTSDKEHYSNSIKGRIRFAINPMALIDLAAILPFYLPFIGIDLRFIRALRLMRIVRVAKVGRYSTSLQMMKRVIVSKKEELLLTTYVLVLLLVVSACIMYHFENPAQPEAFPDIPSTMWWSVVTLTTVSYGDICPITPIGKFIASIMAILGIGMFALPTGILGAGFVEEISTNKTKAARCPHCGKDL